MEKRSRGRERDHEETVSYSDEGLAETDRNGHILDMLLRWNQNDLLMDSILALGWARRKVYQLGPLGSRC